MPDQSILAFLPEQGIVEAQHSTRSQPRGDAIPSERQMAIVVAIVIAVVVGYRMWKKFLCGPQTPDPWGPEIARELETSESEGVCLHCLQEQPPGGWFCPHCGASTGPYNTLNPFLGAFVEGEVLRRGTSMEQPFTPKRIFAYAFLGLGAFQAFPPLLPFYWLALAHNVARSRKRDSGSPIAEDPASKPGNVSKPPANPGI